MIAKLTGVVDNIGSDYLILDVNGVGYLVFVSQKTLSKIGSKGAKVSILIETHVREDHIKLYGFAEQDEKNMFAMLCTVQGVGTRVCMAILSVATPSEILLALQAQDKALFTAADGVGPKLAARILTELKDKAGDVSLGSFAASGAALQGAVSNSDHIYANLNKDAISALVNLGYGQSESFKAVSEVCSANDAHIQDVGYVIRESLKKLGAS